MRFWASITAGAVFFAGMRLPEPILTGNGRFPGLQIQIHPEEVPAIRIGAEMSVAIVVFRSAKKRNFRGAKGDNYFCASD